MRSFLLASLAALAPMAIAQSPCATTFVGNTQRTATDTVNTVFFDISVTNPTGLIFTQFGVNGTGFTGTPAMDFYLTAAGGTAQGNQSNAAAWTLKGTAPTVVVGTNNSATNPHLCVLQTPVFVPPGNYGVALHLKNWRHLYTPITTPPQPTLWTTTEMSIDTTNGRIQGSTLTAPFSGASSSPRTPNVAISYSTTSVAQFTATPTTGNGTVNVAFTDRSVSLDPAGIIAWAWDLDGDNIDDSFVQNPTRAYTCGTYSVRLTAFDALGNWQTTKTNLIVVDALNANFTFAKVGEPAQYQFTSTSSASATTFAWDLDGDTIDDATGNTATFSYPFGCAPVNVRLTVTNSCRTAQRTIQIAPTDQLATPFTANNAGATGYAINFDLNVTNPDGIELCGVYCNVNVLPGGQALTLDMYTCPTTYVGNDLNAAAWTGPVSGAGIAEQIGVPTYIPLASTIYLPPGTHGVTLVLNGAGLAYTNGTGANQTFSNADLTFTGGQVRTVAFSGASTLFTPRVWNGRLAYKTANTGVSAYYTYGAGCAGTLGVPTNTASVRPAVGQTMVVNHANVPAGVIPFLGFSNTLFSGFPLPIDAAPLGAAGCPIRTSADLNMGLAFAAGGVATWSVAIPLDNVFVGLHVYTQSFSFDGINTLGGSFSDASTGVIGN